VKIRKAAGTVTTERFFYSSAIVFALYHLTNYEINFRILILFPVLVLPQFIIGLLTGYLRVKFSFLWGLLLHVIHMPFFISLAVISMLSTTEKLNVKTKDYSMKITEMHSITKSSSYDATSELDTVKSENMELNELLPILLDVDKQYVRFNDETKSKLAIRMNYTSQSKNMKENSDRVLNNLKLVFHFDIKKSKEKCESWIISIKIQ